jgi:hypothetical protein
VLEKIYESSAHGHSAEEDGGILFAKSVTFSDTPLCENELPMCESAMHLLNSLLEKGLRML